MDQEGNVELKGRTKELINRGGIKFNPIDMEIAIASHPSVLQVAIAPVPDPVVGERAGCFITTKEGASLSFDGLKQFLSEKNFAKFTWPEHFVIVREMPMTPTCKVIKSELVRRYISELGRPGSPANTLPLAMPRSRAEITRFQTERKRRAFELAKQTAWYKGKLDRHRSGEAR